MTGPTWSSEGCRFPTVITHPAGPAVARDRQDGLSLATHTSGVETWRLSSRATPPVSPPSTLRYALKMHLRAAHS